MVGENIVMTAEQFGLLMERLNQQPAQQQQPQHQGVGAAAAVGQLGACALGRDKMKRYKKWSDWHKEAKNKLAFLGITEKAHMVSYLKSCAGAELLSFWEKEARVRLEAIPANEEQGIAAQEAHTYDEIITETEKVLLQLVSRDRAVIDLLKMTQGDRNVMEFLAEVEDQAKLCRANEKRIHEDDLIRMALLAGFNDRNLAEKALAEEFDLKTTIQVASTRETSKANARAMQALGGDAEVEVKRVGRRRSRTESPPSDLDQSWVGDKINQLERALDVMKVRNHGKYSFKGKSEENNPNEQDECRDCGLRHGDGRCPAAGRDCYECYGRGHFARAAACPGRQGGESGKENGATRRRRLASTRRVINTSDSSSSGVIDTRRVAADDRRWPGVQEGTGVGTLCRVLGRAQLVGESNSETSDSETTTPTSARRARERLMSHTRGHSSASTRRGQREEQTQHTGPRRYSSSSTSSGTWGQREEQTRRTGPRRHSSSSKSSGGTRAIGDGHLYKGTEPRPGERQKVDTMDKSEVEEDKRDTGEWTTVTRRRWGRSLSWPMRAEKGQGGRLHAGLTWADRARMPWRPQGFAAAE
jgi:hypothetical protein